MSLGSALSRLFGSGTAPDRVIDLSPLAGWTLIVKEETAIWTEYQKRARNNAHVYMGDSAHCRGFADPNRKELVVRFRGLSSTEPDESVLWHEIQHALGTVDLAEHEKYQVKP